MKKYFFVAALVLFILLGVREARAGTIYFDVWPDSTPLTNQYISYGVIFSNATVITAGKSLNEYEFPPYSGSNVVFDDGGPMTVSFYSPGASYFGAYFTYTVPLTLSFYDSLDNLEGTISSAFSSNMALSGDPGSSPNEFMTFSWASGISEAVITGDPSGTSFVMDDLTANAATAATAVPEPSTLLLLGSGLLAIARYRYSR
jgi:hypothetical protein